MKLNFYSKTILTLRSLGKSLAFCLVAATFFVNNAQGQAAKALNFDGVNDYVTIPVKSALNITQNLTIESWIYPIKSYGVQDVISKSSSTSSNSYIFPRTANGWNSMEFLLNLNGVGWKTLRVPFGQDKLEQWHHVAATYDGLTMRIFLDGAQVGSLDFAGTITVNNNALTLGNQTGFSEYFGGTLDEARIFNRALSPCEIVSNMNCELASNNEGLVAYYKLNQGLLGLPNPLETTVQDATATGANGTLMNFGLLNTGLLSNWSEGAPSVSSTTCPVFVPTVVTVSSPQTAVPVSGTIQLFASSVPGATYAWTGPNGFNSTLQNPVIEGAGTIHSGTYTCIATSNGCSGSASIVITVAPRASGLNFDGVNDYITIPNNPILNSKTMTVEAWVYPTSGVSALIQDVVSKANFADNSGFKFPKTDDKWNTFTFEMSVDAQWKTLSASFPTSALNKWNHLAATYDGYFMRIYLNGVLANTLEVTGNFTPATDAPMLIGNQPGRSEFFKGSVDEVRVWTRALSQCEIINNMKTCELNGDNNGIANQVGLGAYYRFNQGLLNANNITYNTLADSSGNGLHGTLANFALNGQESNWIDGKVYGVCDYFPLPMLTASANGSVFQTGSTAKLFAAYGNNNIYNWDGPNSFATSTQNPVLTNVQLNQSGTYTVTTPYVNCVVTASTRIKVSNLPQIIADGPTSFCPSGSVKLTSATTGTSYQWYKDDVIINGATTNSYTATQGGAYSVKVTTATDVTVSAPLQVTIIPDVVAPVANIATLPTINLVAPATVTTVPTATDACAGAITATTNSPLTYTQSGTYTITWIYNDGNGNTSTQTQTVVVTRPADVTPPVLTVPSNITVAASATTCNAVVNFAATATDESEDPTVTITYSQNPNTVFPIGTTTVNVTATDAAGNSSTGSFTVTVTASTVAPITGNTTICVGSTSALATTTTGGTWSSSNPSVATVDASGVVTGIAAGSANIIYTNACGVTASATVNVNAMPGAPVVTVSNSCGSSTLTASNTTGAILWSNGATTSSITVSNAATYTVTQSVNGCTSAPASAVAAPGALPATPVVTVVNNCGSTTLTASNTTGTILWSNGATTPSITVSDAGTYTVTQTIGNCTSAAGSGVAAPKATPAAPVVSVVDNCGSSVLTASATTGSIQWSNGATTSSIAVSIAGTYSATQTVNGCTSAAGSAVAAPKAAPAAPVVSVVDNCGSSVLTASATTGSILWSNGATTSSITVSIAGTYSATQTVNGCTSAAGSAVAAPKATPAAPVVTVVNNCGSSTLTASNTTGSVLWSNGATTSSITVSVAGTYSATQTVNGCTSAAGSAVAAPKATPAAPVVTVVNNCGSSTLTASNTTGSVLWSNGATTASITVTASGNYSVTQTVSGCTSASASQSVTINQAGTPVIAGPTSGSTVTQNPLAAALNFNVFMQTNMSFGQGQSHGPVAIGGDLTIAGDYSVSNNSAGTFKVSNVPVTLLTGGKVIYQGGNGVNVNQNGYVKIGNSTNSYVWYKDQNNAYSPIRITPGANYNGSPRLNLQANSQNLNVSATNNPVFEGNLIDFAAAFNTLKASATSMSSLADNANITNPNGGVIAHTNLPSQVKINLATGLNVLNISASDLNAVQNFTYNNQPDATHILVINVNAPGSYSWNVWNSGGIGDQNTKYILYNFYNATSLNVQGNGSVMGTLFAPNAAITKSNSQNITGQIVGQSFAHTSGTNTYNAFDGTITTGTTTVIAAGSNVTRATNNASCTYTVSGAEFNATATATDNCGVPTLTYTLSGATTGSGSNLANVNLNVGTTTITWTATNGTNTATYSFTVTVTGSIPAAPVVTVADNCGTSTLTASNTTGSVLWSNGSTGSAITVSNAGTYTATQTVNGCVSTAGSAVAAPKATPSAPVVTVVDNCGSSTLTVSNTTGSILWSNGATTASITVSNAGTYAATQTVNGCVSAAGSAVAAPKAVPSAPVVTVVDNCGSSTLTASNTTGSILWSNGATTASITVSNAGTYAATQTVNGCVSAEGSAVAAPKATQAIPVITVVNNCGSSILSTNAAGTIVWSNGATGSSIIVNTNGNYSVTATNNSGCSATSAVSAVTVNTNPVVAAITGATSVATGATTQLADATAGGVWSSLNTSVATVSASGLVTGVTIGSTTIKYTVTNSNGCTTSVTANISVTAPACTTPVFTNTVANVNVNSCNNATAAYTLNVSGTAPVLTYTFSGATTATGSGTGSGATFNVGVTNVTVRAQNNCGTVSQSFTVTVKSTTAPVPTVATLPTITGQCSAGLNATTSTNTVATCNDDCLCCRVVCYCKTSTCKCKDYYSVKSIISYLLSYYFGYTDDNHDCDNSGSGNGGGSTAGNAPTAKDACTGATIVGTTTDPLTYSAQGTYTINWNYTDARGNVTTQQQTVIVNDTQAPVPAVSTLATVTGTCAATVTTAPKANDNCAGTITGTTTDPLTYSAQGTYTIRWTFDDGNGNTATQNQTVIVKDATAPVPQVSSLPSISGSCGLTVTSAPKANDNCAGVITGTTTDPLTYSAKGTYTIRWTYNDGNGNTTTQNQTVNITGGPVATIVASAGSNDFCSDLVLTGSSSVSGASYKWMLGNTVVGTSSQYSLGQNSTEGTYQLYVTTNGCTSSAASYTYSKQNMLNSYTILATKNAIFGKYSKVQSGSVGVTASNGVLQFKGNTAVDGDGAFVKAANINKMSSDNISRIIYGAASVTGTPAMQYNTSNANSYSNYSTAQYATVTLSGNYKTLTIKKGTYATLSGTIFGTIDLEEGASVRFTNATINIDKLLVEDGARDGYYSYVRFAPNSSVRVSTQVSIGSQVLVNPDNYKVTFYMGDKSCDSERFTVTGADTKVIANIIMPSGKLYVTSTDCNDDNRSNCGHGSHSSNSCPHKNHNHKACDHRSHNTSDCNDDVYMTGTFIVESVESKGNTVIWNSFECGSSSVPVTVVNKTAPAPAAIGSTATVKSESSPVTTEEELKITVMPNPSTTYFTLKFESKYETPLNMRVMDANGRVVDAQTKIGCNSTIRVGANYASGTYFAEVTQGNTRKVIQLIKVRG